MSPFVVDLQQNNFSDFSLFAKYNLELQLISLINVVIQAKIPPPLSHFNPAISSPAEFHWKVIPPLITKSYILRYVHFRGIYLMPIDNA